MPENTVRENSRIRWVFYATAAVVLAILVLAVLTLPDIRTNTKANDRTDQINSCASQFRADFDKRLTILQISTARTHATNSRLSELTAAFLAAAQTDDKAEQLRILGEAPHALRSVDQAVSDMNRDALLAYDAFLTYNDRVELRSADLDKFLALCQKETP